MTYLELLDRNRLTYSPALPRRNLQNLVRILNLRTYVVTRTPLPINAR
jgi:hypothetical protein